jgi:hypothetical protein
VGQRALGQAARLSRKWLEVVFPHSLDENERNVVVGSVDNSMGLSLPSLKKLAAADHSGRVRFACVDGNRAAQHIEGVADLPVEIPGHLLAGREDEMTHPDLIG